MKKIFFIEPKSPNLHIYSQFPLPRLGLYILGNLMEKRGWHADIIYEEQQKIDFNKIKTADLVGISTITSTAPRAYAIADKIRKMNIPVIMGGPHVTFLTTEALQHADYVIRGEGEEALPAFIDAWEKGEDFTGIPNLSYLKNGKTIHNPLNPFIHDLDAFPSPDFTKYLFQSKAGAFRMIPVQTSRGCPFDCTFCSVTGMFGKKYRFRSTQNIIEELRRYNDRKNIIFFYDDNFAANKKRAKELLKAMIAENFKFKWTTQVRTDAAKDEELLKLMKKSGCHYLYLGLESVNPRSLEAMKKKQSLDDIIQAVKAIRRHRIHTHGMFVYGFDDDDWATVKKTVRFAKKIKLSSTQFMILTPLPGSKFFKEIVAQGRLLFKDWSLYDAHHVVFQPARLTLSALQKAQIFSHKKFYSLVQIVKKTFRFKWLEIGIAHYARNLNKIWQKRNKAYLKVVDLLTLKKSAHIKVEYKEDIALDR
ncbi:MAG: B12-binding domain-containing radical SAM protein [Candidatus Aminicenantes bacterium]|nr:B12-binding domain-containing radical SAM protein [Candidatus Aminicenantes bacterium]